MWPTLTNLFRIHNWPQNFGTKVNLSAVGLKQAAKAL